MEEPNEHRVKAEEVYSFMQNAGELFGGGISPGSSIFEDKHYKELVCEHLATSLRTEYLRGSNDGRSEELASVNERLGRIV